MNNFVIPKESYVAITDAFFLHMHEYLEKTDKEFKHGEISLKYDNNINKYTLSFFYENEKISLIVYGSYDLTVPQLAKLRFIT